MLVFGLGAQTLLTAANNYFAPFGGSIATSTSANAQVALPRTVTLKNLHCYVNTCPPSGTTAYIKVFQNGGLPTNGLVIQVDGTGCTPGDKSDTSHTEQFIPGDTIELWEQQVSGVSSIAISSCSVEHD